MTSVRQVPGDRAMGAGWTPAGWSWARTATVYITLLSTQYYPGHTVFVSRRCVPEAPRARGPSGRVHLERDGRGGRGRCSVPFRARIAQHGAGQPVAPPPLVDHLRAYLDDPQPLKSLGEDQAFWAALASGERADRSVEVERFEGLFAELRKTGVTLEREWAP